jgi:hypothetical protein
MCSDLLFLENKKEYSSASIALYDNIERLFVSFHILVAAVLLMWIVQ